MTKQTFDSFPIAEPVLKGIVDAGFEHCTPIQGKTLPITLAGKDVAGQAQTGTGKTAAFLITLFHHLVKKKPEERKPGAWVAPRALVIAPTRELALQIERDALVLGGHCGLKIVCVYGGVDYEKQRNSIKSGADVLIVTPGRLIDYYKQKFFSLKSVEVLVIDEADRMFDMGFISDLRYILRNTSAYNKRLSMLFSATLNFRVMELCYEHMNNPEKVAVEPEKITVDEVQQILYHVGSHEKFNLLLWLLEQDKGGRFLVFSNTKAGAEDLEARLLHHGLKAGQISGDVHQRKRIRVLEQFANGEIDVLIATDVASRGIHVDNITHVINYDLPQDPEDYVHRIGRTARMGAKGTAVSMACEDYIDSLERIEEYIKRKIPVIWPSEDMFLSEREGSPRRRHRPHRAAAGKGGRREGGRRPSRPKSHGSPHPRRPRRRRKNPEARHSTPST
ncbi:MAG: DEAD/DEAH box helicase [Nitrospinae bacterium]|nr:DEAD/DEAH box helicase [Nitrospinota bacterium]